MQANNFFLRDQVELEEDLAQRLNDHPDKRWSTAQKYQALNAALLLWGDRVKVPHLYTITGGYVSGTYIYALPYYIEGEIDVQFKAISGSTIGDTDDSQRLWNPVVAYDIDTTAGGGRELRMHYDVYNTSGRIFWWAPNGPIPRNIPLPITSGSTAADATTLTITTRPMIALSGYVKINNEWLAYAGFTESGETITLSNLTRARYNTTAAVHADASIVKWGVQVPRHDLFEQLMYEAIAHCHLYNLNDSSQQERAHHQDQMLFYKQLSEEYWVRHVPSRSPRLRLSRQTIGPGAGAADYRINSGDTSN